MTWPDQGCPCCWLDNLLRVCALAQAGFSITFSYRSYTVSKGNTVLITGKLSNNVYVIENVQMGVQMVSNKCPHERCIHLMHLRLGHMGYNVINKTLRGGKCKILYLLDCQVCKNMKSKSYPVAGESGSVNQTSWVGSYGCDRSLSQKPLRERYAIIIVDDHICFAWVFAMNHKSEVYKMVKYWGNSWLQSKLTGEANLCLLNFTTG